MRHNQKKIVASVIWLMMLLISVESGISQELSINEKDRLEIFEQVWNTINDKYYDAKFNGVDWAGVGKRYRPLILKANDSKAFYLLLDRMAGELRDSHTRVFSSQQMHDSKNQRRAGVGIAIKEIEVKIMVTDVNPDSEAAQAGIKPGMIVREINGKSVGETIENARLSVGVSSSERATKMRIVSRLLFGELNTTLKLGLEDASGKQVEFSLLRRNFSSAPQVSSEVLPSGIAYLKFNQFNPSIEKEIIETLDKFKNAPAMIIDLRGNNGGDGEMGLRFAGYLFAKEMKVAQLITRTGKPPAPEMPMVLQAGKKREQKYANPIVILINEGSASTSELITNALQAYKRAKVFGTQSCGCVLGILQDRPLKGGGNLTMSEFGFIAAKNHKLEGNGVTPDKIVIESLQDIQNGRDIVREQSEEYLKQFLKHAK